MNNVGKEIVKTGTDDRIKKLALAALFAALSYIGFQVFIGGALGGSAGAVGLTIADLTSGYATSAPKTFILKLLIGLIVGLVAHKGFKINEIVEKKKLVLATVCSASCGLLFNIVADPLVGYFYKQYVLGLPQEISEAFAKISALTTSVNAVASVVFATVLYLALRPVLKKEGFLH